VAELRAEALGTGPMGRDIQDLGYGLPRIPIPRTRVNKGKKSKSRNCLQAQTSVLLARLLLLKSAFDYV